MRDISDNPYISRRLRALHSFGLNTFMFGRIAIETRVSYVEFISSIQNLLSALGFDLRQTEIMCLARIIAAYFTDADYSVDKAASDIAKRFHISADFVKASAEYAVKSNRKLSEVCAMLLNISEYEVSTSTLRDAIDAITAVYKIHYNYTVADDDRDDGEELFPYTISRLMELWKTPTKQKY